MKRKLLLEQQLYLDYARSALRILSASLQLARGAEPDFYRVVGVQLRLLLCDTTRQHERTVSLALVTRLWPELRWPVLDAAGRADGTQPALPLDAWLERPLPGIDLPPRLLIRRVCDQDGGAHVDLRQHAALRDFQQAREWILRLGDVALQVLSAL